MPREDVINIKIEADGTITSETPQVSSINHTAADGFIDFIAKTQGGPVTKTPRAKTRAAETHAENHAHIGHGHKH